MTEKLNIYQRLINAQTELKAPKGQYNSFGKYKYRSAEDILEAVKPINAKHGLLLFITDKPIVVGDQNEWHYIEATVTLVNVDNANEVVTVTAQAREPLNKKGMDESQITGTASSYARKYALNGLYLIDDTKDADTDEYKQQQQPQTAKAEHANKGQEIVEPQESVDDAIKKGYATIKGMSKEFNTNEKINTWIKEKGKYEDLRQVNKAEILAWLGKLFQQINQKG